MKLTWSNCSKVSILVCGSTSVFWCPVFWRWCCLGFLILWWLFWSGLIVVHVTETHENTFWVILHLKQTEVASNKVKIYHTSQNLLHTFFVFEVFLYLMQTITDIIHHQVLYADISWVYGGHFHSYFLFKQFWESVFKIKNIKSQINIFCSKF